MGIPQPQLPSIGPGMYGQTGAAPSPWDFRGPGGGVSNSPYSPLPPSPVLVPPSSTQSYVAPASDKELGFNPRGPGQWDAAMMHPLDAITADVLRFHAEAETKKHYPNDSNPQNDEADAFRHAYWSYLMTKAFGAERAKQFGDGHEITVPNPSGERYMDLYNKPGGAESGCSGRGHKCH
jgi:hypothetical protein